MESQLELCLNDCLGFDEVGLRRNFKNVLSLVVEELRDYENDDGFIKYMTNETYHKKLNYLEDETNHSKNLKFNNTLREVRVALTKYRSYKNSTISDGLDAITSLDPKIYGELDLKNDSLRRSTELIMILRKLELYLNKEPVLRLVI